MNYKTEKLEKIDSEIANKVKEIQVSKNKVDIAEAKADGLNIEISETQPGRFRITRDYQKECKSNKKLNRLSI